MSAAGGSLPSVDDVAAALEDVIAALEPGLLSLSRQLERVSEWSLLVMRLLSSGDVAAAGALRLYRRATTSAWAERVPLLPEDLQLDVLHALDGLYAEVLLNAPPSSALPAGRAILDEHPLPPFESAAAIIVACPQGTVDEAVECVPFLRVVETHSTRAIDLAYAAHARTRHVVWFAEALDRADGSVARALVDLDRFDDLLDDALGGVAVMQKANFLASETRLKLLEERSELETALIKTGACAVHDHDVQAYYTYLRARIYGANNATRKAIKLFRKALDMGFSPNRAVSQLAFLLSAVNRDAEARELLRECSEMLVIERGSLKATSTQSIADCALDCGMRPEDLGVEDVSTLFEQTARAHEKAWRASGRKLTARRERALDAFWTACLERLTEVICSVVTVDDIEAALDAGRADELRHLPVEEMLRCQLEELPELLALDRTVLLRAADEGVPGSALGVELVHHFQARLAAGEPLSDLLDRCPAYARSLTAAVRHLESSEAPMRVVSLYAQRSRLKPSSLATFFEAGRAMVPLESLVAEATKALARFRDGRATELWSFVLDARLALAVAGSGKARAEHLDAAVALGPGDPELEARVARVATETGDAGLDELVAQRLTTGARDECLERARAALVERIKSATLDAPPRDCVVRLLRLGRVPELLDVVTDWFEAAGAEVEGEALEIGLVFGSWLHGETSQPRVAATVVDMSWRAFAVANSRGEQMEHLETVLALCPTDERAAGLLESLSRGRRAQQLKWAAGLVAALGGVAGWLLLT